MLLSMPMFAHLKFRLSCLPLALAARTVPALIASVVLRFGPPAVVPAAKLPLQHGASSLDDEAEAGLAEESEDAAADAAESEE